MSSKVRPTGRRIWVAALLVIVCGCDKSDQSTAPETKPAESQQSIAPQSPDQLIASFAGVLLHLSFDQKTLCRSTTRIFARDRSSKGNGAYMRDVVPVKGKFGTAISLDGAKSRVTGSDAALPVNAAPVSMSLWFLARKPGRQILFSYGSAKSPFMRELSLLDPSGLSFFHFGNDNADLENVPISLNEWHHLVATYDNIKQEITFYLDGVKKGVAKGRFWTSPSGYAVGSSDGENNFDGLIDEVVVFNYVLPESDVQKLYKQTEYADNWNYSLESIPECK